MSDKKDLAEVYRTYAWVLLGAITRDLRKGNDGYQTRVLDALQELRPTAMVAHAVLGEKMLRLVATFELTERALTATELEQTKPVDQTTKETA